MRRSKTKNLNESGNVEYQVCLINTFLLFGSGNMPIINLFQLMESTCKKHMGTMFQVSQSWKKQLFRNVSLTTEM